MFHYLTLLALVGLTLSTSQAKIPKNIYPIRLGYIDRVLEFYPVNRLAASLGVPGFADQKIYNYIALGFWQCGDSPSGAAAVWSKPIDYFGDDSHFGSTKAQIQSNLRHKFNNAKSHVLVSAFGLKQMPTSLGLGALECANRLATFVLDNNLDGCDINWQDESTLYSGKGLTWLLSFHNHLRKLIPDHIVTHSPSAAFFRSEDYDQHSYSELNLKIDKTVNFYNVKFYNLGTSRYNSYQELFIDSNGSYSGTAVSQLVKRGVEVNKIVVGKPVAPSDSTGSGWMDFPTFSQSSCDAYYNLKWFAGLALWQYSSDVNGRGMVAAMSQLKELCSTNKDCK